MNLSSSERRNALSLGLVALSASLAINIYVPAFPMIAADLRVSVPQVQFSLVGFLLGLAVGQNIYGPLSDRFGRRAPLCIGIMLFAITSIGAGCANSIEALVVWRVAQGIGACAPIAIPRAIIRDLHTGPRATRMLALVLLVMSASPLFAPMIGSAIIAHFPWQALFWLLALMALASLLLVLMLIPETWPAEHRRSTNIWRGYGQLLRGRRFLALAGTLACAQAAYYAFLSGSSLVLIEIYGIGAWHYSLVLGVGAAAWIFGAQLASALMTRVGAARLVRASLAAGMLTVAIVFVATAARWDGLTLIVIAVPALFMTIGAIAPIVTVWALHPHSNAAGTATAILGTGNFAGGALSGALVSLVADGTALPLFGVMALCIAGANALLWYATPNAARPSAA